MLLEPITCAGKLFQIIIADGKNNCLDGFLNIHTTTKNTDYNAVYCYIHKSSTTKLYLSRLYKERLKEERRGTEKISNGNIIPVKMLLIEKK